MENSKYEDLEKRIEELKQQIRVKCDEIFQKYPDKPEKMSMEEINKLILQAQQPYYWCKINTKSPRYVATELEIKDAIKDVVENFDKLLERELSKLTYTQMNHLCKIIQYGIAEKYYDDFKSLLKKLSFETTVALYSEKNKLVSQICEVLVEVVKLPKEKRYVFEFLGTKSVLEICLNLLNEIESKCSEDERIVVSRWVKEYVCNFK